MAVDNALLPYSVPIEDKKTSDVLNIRENEQAGSNKVSQSELSVRPLVAGDEEHWRDLWKAYLTFYGSSVSEEVYATTFARLIGDQSHDFHALVADRDGVLLGLTHYLFHRHCWRIENVCYLQDLYTAPEARGTGVGRALIQGVYDAADRAGSPSVYWLTQDDNQTARQLYDRIGTLTPFIKYQRP